MTVDETIMNKWIFSCVFAAALAAVSCTDVGTCPSPASIVPGGSCSGDSLQCAYFLASPSPACDGSSVDGGISTSCTCTDGSWVCPSAVQCSAPGGDDGGGAEASSGLDAGNDSGEEDATTDGSGPDAAGDGALGGGDADADEVAAPGDAGAGG